VIDATLVTIHGFGSSPETWGRLTAKWHADDELNGLQIEPFGYPSPRRPRLPLSPKDVPDYDDIAQVFAAKYKVRFAALSNIAIVTHSQGGLILQRFLTWMLDQRRGRDLARIRTIVTLACPNGGSDYLRSIRNLLGADRNPQAASLQVLNRQVADTNRRVLADIVNANGVGDDHCHIPFHVYAGDSDAIVPPASAQGAFPDFGTLPGDHSTILDPAAPGNFTAETVRYHILDDMGAAGSPDRPREPLDNEGRPTTDPAIREPGAERAYRFRVTNIGKAPMLDTRPELIDAAGEVCTALPDAFLGVLQPGEHTEFILTVTEPADRNPLRLRYRWTDWGGPREHVSNVTVPPS
jgi:pimeloyl-ACP methyl ester carboxylesterase